MWPFSKKKVQGIDLPPLTSPKAKLSDEIELIPEELPVIPEELPSLEEKSVSVPEKEYEGPVFPSIPEEKQAAAKEIEIAEKFISSGTHNTIIGSMNDVLSDFDNLDYELSRVIELKTTRYEKIDGLQTALEEIGKKMISVDNILFGGQQ